MSDTRSRGLFRRVKRHEEKWSKPTRLLRIRRGLDLAGTSEGELFQGRDLAGTTDHPSVLGEILAKYVGSRAMKGVFPGYSNDPWQFLGLVKA